jgi:hypothetical protein
VKFRKKPVVIDAFLIADLLTDVNEGRDRLPPPVRAALDHGVLLFGPDTLYVKTLEGEMRAERSDWLIRGVNGELYPCKPDIFEKTYEPAETQPAPKCFAGPPCDDPFCGCKS